MAIFKATTNSRRNALPQSFWLVFILCLPTTHKIWASDEVNIRSSFPNVCTMKSYQASARTCNVAVQWNLQPKVLQPLNLIAGDRHTCTAQKLGPWRFPFPRSHYAQPSVVDSPSLGLHLLTKPQKQSAWFGNNGTLSLHREDLLHLSYWISP
jgi:hypothetical protein